MKKKSVPPLQADIYQDYTWSQVKTILEMYKLDPKEFSEWMTGQTCPIIKVGKKAELGYYGWDLFRWIKWKTDGTPPVFD